MGNTLNHPFRPYSPDRIRRVSLVSDGGWLLIAFVLVFSLAGGDFAYSGIFNLLRWVVMAALIADSFVRTKMRNLEKYDALFILPIVFAAASTAWSISTTTTIARTLSIVLFYLTIYFAIWQRISQWRLNKLYDLLLVPAIGLFAISVTAGFLLPESTIEAGRLKGIFSNANTLGLFASFCFPIAIRRCIVRPSNYSYGSAILSLLAVFMSGCRTALLNIALTFIVVVLRLKFRQKWAAITILGAISAVYIGVMYQEFMDSAVRLETLRTGSNRTIFWNNFVDFIAERPLLGHGFGTEDRVNEFYGVDWRLDFNIRGDRALNSYLGITSETGLIGLAIFMLPLLLLAWKSLWVKQSKDIIFSSASIIAGLITAIFESYLFSAGNAFCYVFWIHVMLVVHYFTHSPEGNGQARPKRRPRSQKTNRLARSA